MQAVRRARPLVLATVLLGIGVMAAIDEIVFHQLLRWHHFYDRSTPEMGLISDGLLHGAELIVLVGGFFLFLDVLQQGPVDRTTAWGGFLLGAGGFQFLDGIVNHKVLRLHQIRYDVDILPYDIAWLGASLLLLGAGALLLRRAAGLPQTR